MKVTHLNAIDWETDKNSAWQVSKCCFYFVKVNYNCSFKQILTKALKRNY